jgi:hypothetical protein
LRRRVFSCARARQQEKEINDLREQIRELQALVERLASER